ncbi:MAG: hypothetical protein ABGF52_11355 [Candidatus Asgardarchaeum sp.]
MGYCTENDIVKTIAQSLTTATSATSDGLGTFSNLMNVGNVLDKNLVSTDNVNYYIQLADSEIDGSLSQLYITPFCELCDFESSLYSSIDEYNPYIVLEKYCPFAAGDMVILTDGTREERHEIGEVIDGSTFATVSEIQYFFGEDTRILRVTYPPPIRFISARIASANIYDKYFSSESSPNTSGFGDKLRELAENRLNDILNGSIILHGHQRIGRRFYNPNLVEQYALPTGGKIPKQFKQIKQ